MKNLVIFTFILSFALMIGCSSITVKTDYDREYNFNTFKTYRWATDKEINPNDELAKAPLIYKRVQQAVDVEMLSKGIRLTESDNPDLVIVAHAGVKERIQVHQTGGHWGGWYDPYWGPYGGTTHVSHYEEGTLVIDIVVMETKELGWRGMGTSILKNLDDPDKVTEYINNWVKKIMAEFPPKG